MTIHTEICAALSGLAGDRIYPLVAPEKTPAPYVVFQVVGGDAMAFISGEKPEKRIRRVQVSVWSTSIIEAEQIAEQVEDAFRAVVALQAQALTIAIDTYDETTDYRGKMQDFNLFC